MSAAESVLAHLENVPSSAITVVRRGRRLGLQVTVTSVPEAEWLRFRDCFGKNGLPDLDVVSEHCATGWMRVTFFVPLKNGARQYRR